MNWRNQGHAYRYKYLQNIENSETSGAVEPQHRKKSGKCYSYVHIIVHIISIHFLSQHSLDLKPSHLSLLPFLPSHLLQLSIPPLAPAGRNEKESCRCRLETRQKHANTSAHFLYTWWWQKAKESKDSDLKRNTKKRQSTSPSQVQPGAWRQMSAEKDIPWRFAVWTKYGAVAINAAADSGWWLISGNQRSVHANIETLDISRLSAGASRCSNDFQTNLWSRNMLTKTLLSSV